MAKQPRHRKKGRTWEKHPDDPGREPYRVVDLWKLHDLYSAARADFRQPHQGALLKKATFFRPSRHPGRAMGDSIWAHSPEQAVGCCLRRLQGVPDWPADRYVAIPYQEWVDEVSHPRISCIAGFPPPEPKPAVETPPVDPLAPTDPAPPAGPEDAPTAPVRAPLPKPLHGLRPRSRRVPEGQLALTL